MNQPKVRQAFVLAAGKGERLRPLTNQRPKPLVEVGGRPILSHIFDRLESLKLERVVVNAWYLKEQIQDFCERESKTRSFEIEVSVEEDLLGTAGGLKKAMAFLEPPFLMLNGDCYWEGDLMQLFNSPPEAEASWAVWAARPEETSVGVFDGRIVQVGDAFCSREPSSLFLFSGLELINQIDVDQLPDRGCIIKDYWIPRLNDGAFIAACSEVFERWEDLGTIDRLEGLRAEIGK